MHDRELYRQILGVQAPWQVSDVEVDLPGNGVTVHIEHSGGGLSCPECGQAAPGYDTRERRWRHLDTCQYKTWLPPSVAKAYCQTTITLAGQLELFRLTAINLIDIYAISIFG